MQGCQQVVEVRRSFSLLLRGTELLLVAVLLQLAEGPFLLTERWQKARVNSRHGHERENTQHTSDRRLKTECTESTRMLHLKCQTIQCQTTNTMSTKSTPLYGHNKRGETFDRLIAVIAQSEEETTSVNEIIHC